MTRNSIHTGSMMRIVALLLAFSSVQVSASECDELAPPSITVKRLDEPVSLDTSLSYKSIAILATALHRPESRVLGLTRGMARVTVETKTALVVDRTGRWECASPQLVVTYGFSPTTVYVAREFPKGGCAYNEIYQHELRHVKTHRDHLVAIEKGLVDTLTQRFATGSVWRGPVGQTSLALARELNERWVPYISREIERVNLAQALIDTPQEYARVAASCNGEMQKLIR